MIYKNIDELSKQVGGSLRLTTLIMSRARQLVKRASPLIETDTDDPIRIAFSELLQSKIKLNDVGEQVAKVLESKKVESPLESEQKS
ncbi:MAG: DNA-directed RNA polymerase subunit omega [Planctomycetia bacterium]|nr:DNA-directed RNA polymerase subunit omega [Planctomycetia bacterium]